MSENTATRHKLEKIYGKGCMFQKAHIAELIEKMGGIKTYKKYVTQTKYTRRKIKRCEKELHYHHLVHKAEGGEVSLENGVVINRLAHQYLHSLPREQEEVINNMLREYKLGCAILTGNGVKQVQEIELDFNDCMTIPLLDNEIKNEKGYEEER